MKQININIIPVFKKMYNPGNIMKDRTVFNLDYVYFVLYGGRSAGKTWSVFDAVVLEASLRPVRVLVARLTFVKMRESVVREIKSSIIKLGLISFFKFTLYTIEGKNGSHFFFAGLKENSSDLKGFAQIDICVIEEAENVPEQSWRDLLPTLRPSSGRLICIIIFNPDHILQATYQRWILDPPSKTLQIKANWSDNPYFPDNLNSLRIRDENSMPIDTYNKEWEGIPYSEMDRAILQISWIEAAENIEFKKGKISVGYDPAGQGKDFNAVCVKNGNAIILLEEWQKSDNLREATFRALNIAIKNNADYFCYDASGGLGDGASVFIKDYLKNLVIGIKRPKIIAMIAGSKATYAPKSSPGYANLKAQYHGYSATKFYASFRKSIGEDVSLDDCIALRFKSTAKIKEKLIKELSAPIWVQNELGKMLVESKRDMLKRTNLKSPNLADAIILAIGAERVIVRNSLSSLF